MKSIIQINKECFICKTTRNLNKHHILHGSANRRISEDTGLWCYLCIDHHTGQNGVHKNRELDLELIQYAQRKYEETHSRDEWRSLFTKSWL